eukprot:CAMPEP_0196647760 /NCGR_PEP_ID=MMETSP1085-20130531/12432_1 /TAXON_ID=41879 ORGANISM="Pycnococcus sp, Strain CCMP1998" /NCGR_SAMPLE_ID=MMETSP1085 /ASSEMBLY_ACC=CAM_ASM_000807 /LENGTH=40 /DNA_ID= /DNA_START= /DNA_END= /DNA_ORIENTATION=
MEHARQIAGSSSAGMQGRRHHTSWARPAGHTTTTTTTTTT